MATLSPAPSSEQSSHSTRDASVVRRLHQLPFSALPSDIILRAFGVEYAHIHPPEGGDLFVTRYGWPLVEQLHPANWYTDEWYAEQGQHLPGATGAVYHVLSKPVNGISADLVVKFSRVAQDVSIIVETSFPDDVPAETIAAARFNSPMEEFGLVMELRRGAYGPRDTTILTQRPLAIYTPPEEFNLWQLGRDTSKFHRHRFLLAEDQEQEVKAIELDIKRIYVMLYGWIDGRDAEEIWRDDGMTDEDFYQLTPRVIHELARKGFRVLDNKPKHFILRERSSDRGLLRRNKRDLTYALVDFEFLQRTQEHQDHFKAQRQASYRHLKSRSRDTLRTDTPSHLSRETIFGIDYVYGQTPDGGRLWVVGNDPDLFDYFVPDRWRRTPRVKLSPNNEVYHTRTRDNIHVVYRRSRVGSRPQADPLTEEGRQIRKHGFNSPFEEVVIAERLRQMGIPTTFPRAVYQTGHQSTTAAYLGDPRRFADHADIRVPGTSEPVLVPDYDYYTIWDHFRGLGPGQLADTEEAMDLEQARERGLLDEAECAGIMDRVGATLNRINLSANLARESEFVVYLDETGRMCRHDDGAAIVATGVDALMAYEVGLIKEDQYREALSRLAARLHAADCEKLDAKGSHLLLSMDPDGNFALGRDGNLHAVLCSYEFIRGLYRPIR